MNLGGILIALIWLILIADAFLEGLQTPLLIAQIELPPLSVWPAWIDPAWVDSVWLNPVWIIPLSMIICGGMSFWLAFSQRRRVMEDLPFVTNLIDRNFGQGTYQKLCRQLRPFLLSVLTSFVAAMSCLHATYTTTRHFISYGIGGLLLATAIGIFGAYLLSRRHPPLLQ